EEVRRDRSRALARVERDRDPRPGPDRGGRRAGRAASANGPAKGDRRALTKPLLALGASAGMAAVIFVLLTRDPTDSMAVVAVLGGASLAIGCAVALVGVAVDERDAALARPRRRNPRRIPAMRRGFEIGSLVAALGLLRAVDGLNLMGTAAVGAFLALRDTLDGVRGRVRIVGCPAEERGNGKVLLMAGGAFEGVEAALMYHPGDRDEIDPLMLAMVNLDVELLGK